MRDAFQSRSPGRRGSNLRIAGQTPLSGGAGRHSPLARKAHSGASSPLASLEPRPSMLRGDGCSRAPTRRAATWGPVQRRRLTWLLSVGWGDSPLADGAEGERRHGPHHGHHRRHHDDRSSRTSELPPPTRAVEALADPGAVRLPGSKQSAAGLRPAESGSQRGGSRRSRGSSVGSEGSHRGREEERHRHRDQHEEHRGRQMHDEEGERHDRHSHSHHRHHHHHGEGGGHHRHHYHRHHHGSKSRSRSSSKTRREGSRGRSPGSTQGGTGGRHRVSDGVEKMETIHSIMVWRSCPTSPTSLVVC